MRRAVLALVAGASLIGGSAIADAPKNTQDLEKLHTQIEQLMAEVSKAEDAHGHNLGGHAQRAGDYLNQAAKEVRAAIDFVNSGGAKAPK